MLRSSAEVIIANAATTSIATTVPSGFVLAGIITPAALTGANISLLGAPLISSASYVPVYNGGSLYSVAMGTSRYIAFDTKVTQGLSIFQLVSDSAEGASRTFQAVYTKE